MNSNDERYLYNTSIIFVGFIDGRYETSGTLGRARRTGGRPECQCHDSRKSFVDFCSDTKWFELLTHVVAFGWPGQHCHGIPLRQPHRRHLIASTFTLVSGGQRTRFGFGLAIPKFHGKTWHTLAFFGHVSWISLFGVCLSGAEAASEQRRCQLTGQDLGKP